MGGDGETMPIMLIYSPLIEETDGIDGEDMRNISQLKEDFRLRRNRIYVWHNDLI